MHAALCNLELFSLWKLVARAQQCHLSLRIARVELVIPHNTTEITLVPKIDSSTVDALHAPDDVHLLLGEVKQCISRVHILKLIVPFGPDAHVLRGG